MAFSRQSSRQFFLHLSLALGRVVELVILASNFNPSARVTFAKTYPPRASWRIGPSLNFPTLSGWLQQSALPPTSSNQCVSPSGFWPSPSPFTFWRPAHSKIAIIISIFPKNMTNHFPSTRLWFFTQWLHACYFQ